MENATGSLSRWERRGLILLIFSVIPLGAYAVYRNSAMDRRMGDARIFFRAAWAVRAGEDIYDVTDQVAHYCYPALLAIVLTPLANPGFDVPAALPYTVSLGIWYVFGVLCLIYGVHVLARALEHGSSDRGIRAQPRYCRRWWALRLWPLLVCLPPIGHTLMRGQVNLLVLAIFCAALAAVLHGHRFRAGLWLSWSIVVKIIPAFLLLFPLVRRDFRFMVACGVGLVIGLLVIPAATFGPERAWLDNWKLAEVLLLPGLGMGTDQSRAKELITVTGTDSQSILAVLHNTLHPQRQGRPDFASAGVRLFSHIIGGIMTCVAIVAWRRRRHIAKERGRPDGAHTVIFLGLLILNMLYWSPVCHLHYFCLSLPLVMGLLLAAWESPAGSPGKVATILLWLYPFANLPAHFPGLEVLRDGGLAFYASLSLWVLGVVQLWRTAEPTVMVASAESALRAA